MITSFLSELYGRSPVLTITGFFNVAILLGCLVGMQMDGRLILGINPWIKPAKFTLSIGVYVWTIAWLVAYLPDYARSVRLISWGVAATMVIEIVFICLQSWRGVTSHFNFSTPFNSTIIGLMGIAILVNTLLVVWMLVLFFRQSPVVSGAMLRGIQLGIVIFLIGSYYGSAMISRSAHSVGVEDGGPGLPFVNWSTVGGDIRIAHALGLHALQILPLIGYLVGRQDFGDVRKQISVGVVGAIYSAIVIWTYLQALAGHPFIPRGPS